MIDSVLPFLLSKAVCCLTIAYTGQSSYLRLLSSVLVAACCIVSSQSTLVSLVPGYIGSEYVIGFVLQANNLLCLTKIAPPPGLESSAQLRWALYETFNHRGGVSDGQIPPFDMKNPRNVPSKRNFLLRQLLKMTLAAMMIYLLTMVHPTLELDDWLDVPSDFVHRISSVTSKEALVRVYMAFITQAMPYASLQAAHAMFAFVAVVCGDSPAHWRPIFGDVWEASSIRNFYRNFWHSLMRKAFTTHAVLFNDALRLPRKSQLSRFSVVMVTFGLSAMMHLAAVPLGSLRCSLPTVKYYLGIGGAIILEHMVAASYESLRGGIKVKELHNTQGRDSALSSSSRVTENDGNMTRRRQQVSSKEGSDGSQESSSGRRRERPSRMYWRLLGYCWVIFFSVWNTSRMAYATEQCAFDTLVERQMASNETLAFF